MKALVAAVVALAAAIGAAGYWWVQVGSPEAQHRSIVRLHLNDPDSAVFGASMPGRRVAGVWCGELNARNRMGGMVGFTKYVAEMPELHTSNADDDTKRTYSRVTFEGSETFDSKWGLMCQ